MKCFWNDDFDFFTNNVINADWYHPIYLLPLHTRGIPSVVSLWMGDSLLG